MIWDRGACCGGAHFPFLTAAARVGGALVVRRERANARHSSLIAHLARVVGRGASIFFVWRTGARARPVARSLVTLATPALLLAPGCQLVRCDARRSQSRDDSRGIVGLVSVRNAAPRWVRRALVLASSSCSLLFGAALLAVMGRLLCDRHSCVCAYSALAGACILGERRFRRAPPRLSARSSGCHRVVVGAFSLAPSRCSSGVALATACHRSSTWRHAPLHVRAHACRSLALVSPVGLVAQCARRGGGQERYEHDESKVGR